MKSRSLSVINNDLFDLYDTFSGSLGIGHDL